MTRMKIATLSMIIAGALAFAQDPQQPPPQQQGDQPDAPGRAARLSLVQGNVTFQPGSVDDWVPATLNRPLTTGDRLWTDTGARAELNLGSAAVRLNARTNLSIINLDDRTAQFQLSLGTMSLRVRRLADDEVVEIDTPQAALSVLRPGEYRIEVNEQGDTTIVGVRGGQLEATAGQAMTINPREQVRIMAGAGDGAPPVVDRRDNPPADPFEIFCEDRDRREDTSQSAKYVSRDMPGYSDLDANGGWRDVPGYGPVWTPAGVPPGWAPYRYGHWAWIQPWGWTWVDDAPWGYAPFHYGRWVNVGGAWGWVPGPVVVGVRPMYAPALVAFVGGPRFGVAIGIGGGAAVGWFPLGPREVFVPGYAYSPAYVERVNVTNTVIVNRAVFTNVNVTNVTYVNRSVPGAVVAVSNEQMISGRPVGAIAVRVPAGVVEHEQVTHFAAVAPQREAVLGGRAPAGFAPPASVMNRTVVTRNAPPPPPVAFERQRAALAANPGHPVNHAALTQIRSSSPPPARPMYRPVQGAAAAPRTQAPAVQRPALERPAERTNTPGPLTPRPQTEARPTTSPAERTNTPPASQGHEATKSGEHEGKQPPHGDSKKKSTSKEKEHEKQ